ncbi:hypothetical protein [Conyzicola sp.]|uniref:hypothetical protein n=1 Tax=Conyzicola sp. TaxID=1969404 RepID=UPI00398A4FE0
MTFSGHISRTVNPAARVFTTGRAGAKIDRFVVHHQAGYSATTLGTMTSGSVSATYVINGDGTAVGVVHEEHTPFTNGNLAWNRRSRGLFCRCAGRRRGESACDQRLCPVACRAPKNLPEAHPQGEAKTMGRELVVSR